MTIETQVKRADDAGSGANGRPTLRNFWHPIARASEVTDQPKRFKLLGEDLVAFRDADGPVAFKDLCIHRGTALSLGWITEGRLTCAYHGWQYDREGACVRIPQLPEGAPIPRKARAIAYRAEERYDLVWVALDEPARPLPSWPKDVWNSPDWKVFYATHLTWNTTAGRLIENFMDFSHFPFVHEGLLGSRDHTIIEPELVDPVTPTDFGFTFAFQQNEPNELYPSGEAMTRYQYTLYLPFTVHVNRIQPDGRESVISMPVTPTEPGRIDLHLFQARNFGFEQPDHVFKDFSDLVISQDQTIVESQRPQEIPLDLREELHIKVPDENTIAYRRALSEIQMTGGVEFMP